MSGTSDEDVFGVLKHGWGDTVPGGSIRWFSGDPDYDPWEWRNRVLTERGDIAYAKLFFKKAGYITRQWYPYFLAIRRRGDSFADEYANGTVSNAAKRIYAAVDNNGALPVHEIKRIAGFRRDENGKFEGALAELQAKLYLTVRGQMQKISSTGTEYGWPSAVFCTTEYFWGDNVFDEAAEIDADDAYKRITEQILTLNPNADHKKIDKFIRV